MNNALARAIAALAVATVDVTIIYIIPLLINHPLPLHYAVISFGVIFTFVLFLLDGIARNKGE